MAPALLCDEWCEASEAKVVSEDDKNDKIVPEVGEFNALGWGRFRWLKVIFEPVAVFCWCSVAEAVWCLFVFSFAVSFLLIFFFAFLVFLHFLFYLCYEGFNRCLRSVRSIRCKAPPTALPSQLVARWRWTPQATRDLGWRFAPRPAVQSKSRESFAGGKIKTYYIIYNLYSKNML